MSEELVARYGTPTHFEDTFHNVDRSHVREDFRALDASKGKKQDKYELSRQKFLKLLSQHKMIWHPTNDDCDMNVEVARIYRHDRYEHLAFMRIEPRGFRAERLVPTGVEIIFHLLIGRVQFSYKRRPKIMTTGDWITVSQRTTYAIRSISEDQPAFLVFRIVDKKRKSKQDSRQPYSSI